MTFVEAAKYILEKNGNKPMSAKEIWEEAELMKIVDTAGKTPELSLHSIVLRNCVDTPVKKGKSNNMFLIVGNNPMKFRLKNFVPKNIKESLINDGFITMDVLKEILAKNNINIEI